MKSCYIEEIVPKRTNLEFVKSKYYNLILKYTLGTNLVFKKYILTVVLFNTSNLLQDTDHKLVYCKFVFFSCSQTKMVILYLTCVHATSITLILTCNFIYQLFLKVCVWGGRGMEGWIVNASILDLAHFHICNYKIWRYCLNTFFLLMFLYNLKNCFSFPLYFTCNILNLIHLSLITFKKIFLLLQEYKKYWNILIGYIW